MSIPGRQTINIGLPNEPTNSDTIRDAFVKIENNFTNLFSQASSITNFVGNTGISTSVNATSGTTTITNTGVTSLVAGNNISLSQTTGNITISVVGIPDAINAITVTGNDQPNITTVGNLTTLEVAGNVNVGGTISGSGAGLANLNAANLIGGVPTSLVAGTVTTNAQPNITSVGNLTSLTVNGNIDGNGSISLSMLGTGNANANTYLRGDGTWNGNVAVLAAAPVSNTSSGTAGQIAYDSGGNLFVCVESNTWSKITGTTSW